jgi:hypothetical protein
MELSTGVLPGLHSLALAEYLVIEVKAFYRLAGNHSRPDSEYRTIADAWLESFICKDISAVVPGDG